MKRSNIIFILFAVFLTTSLYVMYHPHPGSEKVEVDHVIDGDTFVTRYGVHVRLIGVDTPELDGPFEEAANEARDWLRDRIEEDTVELRYDDKWEGPYGRRLAYVYHEGTFINKELVKLDLAEVSLYDNRAKAEELKSAR